MIRVTTFRWVPPVVQGLVRDLRVRWALEEAGLAYEERLIGREDQVSKEYRAQQPFGQVPVYEEDGLTLFESGSIVLHIAEKSEVLMPRETVLALNGFGANVDPVVEVPRGSASGENTALMA